MCVHTRVCCAFVHACVVKYSDHCIQTGTLPDLLATSGDYLRTWRVSDNEARQECLLNNVCEFVYYLIAIKCSDSVTL